MQSKVSIRTLNWNGLANTTECLESLKKITYPNYDVIVVDNGSKGDDVKVLREKFKSYVYIIENDKDYGFAEGSNIGIRYALKNLNSDYILLLDNDTTVDPEFLTELVKVAESDPKIGIVGSLVYYHNEPKKIWFGGGKINWWEGATYHLHLNEIDNGQINEIKEVDYIVGCALMAKREVFEKIGLLDLEYFIYFEETDFCVRAKRAGYKIVFVPGSKIWHKISSSGGGEFSPTFAYYYTRNKILFMKKNAPKLCWVTFPFFFIGYFIKHLSINIKKGRFDVVRSMLKAASF